MKHLHWLAIIAPILVVSCKSRHEEHDSKGVALDYPKPKWNGGPPPKWTELDAPLEHYVAKDPETPIIVAFGADWVATTQLNWQTLSMEGTTEALNEAGFLCLSADLTHENQLARDEMRRFRHESVPLTVIYDPTIREWEVKPHIFTTESVSEWIKVVRQRHAETGTGKPATRPKSNSGGGQTAPHN